ATHRSAAWPAQGQDSCRSRGVVGRGAARGRVAGDHLDGSRHVAARNIRFIRGHQMNLSALRVEDPDDRDLELGEQIGSGVEAHVFRVRRWREGRWAAKIYLKEEAAARKEAKLHVMLAAPPDSLRVTFDDQELSLVAWPHRLIRHADGRPAGFLMPLA